MRLRANQPPRSTPCLPTASAAYSEQLGLNRQAPPGPNTNIFTRERNVWYARTKTINVFRTRVISAPLFQQTRFAQGCQKVPFDCCIIFADDGRASDQNQVNRVSEFVLMKSK